MRIDEDGKSTFSIDEGILLESLVPPESSVWIKLRMANIGWLESVLAAYPQLDHKTDPLVNVRLPLGTGWLLKRGLVRIHLKEENLPTPALNAAFVPEEFEIIRSSVQDWQPRAQHTAAYGDLEHMEAEVDIGPELAEKVRDAAYEDAIADIRRGRAILEEIDTHLQMR